MSRPIDNQRIMQWRLPAAIALLSAGALAYEILLIRILSIIQWHHFAGMVISLALLGYGASGTLLTIVRGRLGQQESRRIFTAGACLFSLLTVFCFALAQRIPFNPLEVVWNPRQLVALVCLYLVMTLPFLAAATCIGLALMQAREEIPRIYRSDLVGAGLGAAGVILAMFWVSAATCLRGISCLGMLAAALVVGAGRTRRRGRRAAFVALAGLVLAALWPSSWLELRLSQYKALSKALLVPGAKLVAERFSPLGLLSAVDSPLIPFRHAPGLSLSFPGDLPQQIAVFGNGESMTVINSVGEGDTGSQFLAYLTSALPYALLENPSVLVLGAGGGGEVLSALRHGAKEIYAIEPDRQMAQLVLDEFAKASGDLYRRPEVQLKIEDPRRFLARTARRFDLIQLNLLEGATAPVLTETYLLTVESLITTLQRIERQGLLAITSELRIPPRESLKLFATAVEALVSSGASDPARQLALIRSWGTITMLVKPEPFTDSELESFKRFCVQRSFDVSYYPGMAESEANRFNHLERPFLYQGSVALLGNEAARFVASYKFDLRPATDDRPFFSHFFRWRSLRELLSLRGKGGIPLIDWGYPVLVATVLQALLAGLVLILLPLRVVAGSRGGARGAGQVATYFSCLGVGFLFVELAFIQQLTLFLGHPLYAISVVLAAFLVFAGLGSGAARSGLHRQLTIAAKPQLASLAIAALSLLYLLLLPGVLRVAMQLATGWKVALTLALVAPLAFVMGMPFPLGLMRLAAQRGDWVPWAWAINGCTSVVGAAAAPVLAIHYGFSAVVLAAVICYFLAAGAWPSTAKTASG